MLYLKLLPDADRDRQEILEDLMVNGFHMDKTIRTPLLNDLLVSFRWRPIINETLLEEFSRPFLTGNNETDDFQQVPRFLLLGISAHHMIREYKTDHLAFQRGLTRLLHLLDERLIRPYGAKVVWMNQYPTVDFFGFTGEHNTDIFAEKLEKYNAIVRKTIADSSSSVEIWDSANPLVEDYVRSCLFDVKRSTSHRFKSWAECLDYIHTGYSALSQAMQLILNDVCNGHLSLD